MLGQGERGQHLIGPGLDRKPAGQKCRHAAEVGRAHLVDQEVRRVDRCGAGRAAGRLTGERGGDRRDRGDVAVAGQLRHRLQAVDDEVVAVPGAETGERGRGPLPGCDRGQHEPGGHGDEHAEGQPGFPELPPPSPQHHDRGPAHAHLPCDAVQHARRRHARPRSPAAVATACYHHPGSVTGAAYCGWSWSQRRRRDRRRAAGDPVRRRGRARAAVCAPWSRRSTGRVASGARARARRAGPGPRGRGGRPAAAGPPPGGPATGRISATLGAAEAYARDPGDQTELALFECATDSYPFGPGEGHYGITERDGCEPGSGCRSGAGTLLFAARETGFAVVIQVLTAELAPWLRTSAAEPGP